MCKMGHLGGKIALCFDSKQSVILTQTFGHKRFSDGKLAAALCCALQEKDRPTTA